MNEHKFIGTFNPQVLNQNFGTAQWSSGTFSYSPIPVVSLPPTTVAVYGSAGTSMPTTSCYGMTYVAAQNIIRSDYDKNGNLVYDQDRYVVVSNGSYCSAYMEPKGTDHHISGDSPIFKAINFGKIR